MCVWLKRESGSERKGGRWHPQQKIVKWVNMAEEQRESREMRERDELRERDEREIEKEREREKK